MEGSSGFDQTVLEANAAWDALGESIIAFEIGNEVNGEFPLPLFQHIVPADELL